MTPNIVDRVGFNPAAISTPLSKTPNVIDVPAKSRIEERTAHLGIATNKNLSNPRDAALAQKASTGLSSVKPMDLNSESPSKTPKNCTEVNKKNLSDKTDKQTTGKSTDSSGLISTRAEDKSNKAVSSKIIVDSDTSTAIDKNVSKLSPQASCDLKPSETVYIDCKPSTSGLNKSPEPSTSKAVYKNSSSESEDESSNSKEDEDSSSESTCSSRLDKCSKSELDSLFTKVS